MIVADHSKFNKVFAARFAKWTDIDTLVTDEQPTGKLKSVIKQANTKVVVCGAGSPSH